MKPEVTFQKPTLSLPKPGKTIVSVERQGDQLIMSPPVVQGDRDPLSNYAGGSIQSTEKESLPKKESKNLPTTLLQRKPEKPKNSETPADALATPVTPLEAAIKNMPEILRPEQREIIDRHFPNMKNRNRTSSEIKIDQNVGFPEVSQSPVFHMKRSNTATDFMTSDVGLQRERRSSACVSGRFSII